MTKEALVKVLAAAGRGYVEDFYRVKTFEEVAEDTGVSVEDLTDEQDKWESYGGRIVGCLELRDDLEEWLANRICEAGEDLGSIWENGFCGCNYGGEGRPHWATGLTVIEEYRDAQENGYVWDEEVEDYVSKGYKGKLEWSEEKDNWVDIETGEVVEVGLWA